MQFRVYPYDYDNYKLETNVLKSATDIASVYIPWIDSFMDIEEYPNIKKIHIFTLIDYKDDLKSFENDSRFKIYYIDEYDRDPFKDCDVKFDYIYLATLENATFLNMKILNDALNHLKDENSIVVKADAEDAVIIKMAKKSK